MNSISCYPKCFTYPQMEESYKLLQLLSIPVDLLYFRPSHLNALITAVGRQYHGQPPMPPTALISNLAEIMSGGTLEAMFCP